MRHSLKGQPPVQYNTTWFDYDGSLLKEIPYEAVEEVSDCKSSEEIGVRYWQKELVFIIPSREFAIDHLYTLGYDVDTMMGYNTEQLSCLILWLACRKLDRTNEWEGLQRSWQLELNNSINGYQREP